MHCGLHASCRGMTSFVNDTVMIERPKFGRASEVRAAACKGCSSVENSLLLAYMSVSGPAIPKDLRVPRNVVLIASC